MSKTTLAIIAGISAVTGAAATAAIYASQKEQKPPLPTTTITTKTSTPTSISTSTGPLAPAPDSRPHNLRYNPPPVNPNGLLQYGFPGPVSDLNSTLSTISSFDRRTRNPHWVAEHITPASLIVNDADRKFSTFVEDANIPSKFRAKLHDYFRSGYDRGHQVPAADAKWSQDALDQTFLLSNMCPQVGDGFNRDYWAHLEDFCRHLTSFFPSVRIVTGPLYLPQYDPKTAKFRVSYEVIGNPPNVAVPTHFYKVIFAEDGKTGGKVSLAAFVLPNAPIANEKPLTDFDVSIEAVERASGLEFAPKLPSSRRGKLCEEVRCTIISKDWTGVQKDLTGYAPKVQKLDGWKH